MPSMAYEHNRHMFNNSTCPDICCIRLLNNPANKVRGCSDDI